MKRLIYICFMILIFSLLFSGCQNNDNPDKEDIILNESPLNTDNISGDEIIDIQFTVGMSEDIWNSANMENSKFNNIAEFSSEVEYYIEAISEFISKENWVEVYKEKHGVDYICHIDYQLTSGASHVENGYSAFRSLIPRVYLKKDFFEHDLAPIAHETTHIIAPFYSSLSLREGLASYCQDKFGENPSVFNWGIDVHACANLYFMYSKEDFDKVAPVIGTADTLQAVYAGGDLRELFYNMSYSFTKYLIDSYGIDSFMQLYDSEDLIADYAAVCGKSFDNIKEDWYEYIETYSDSISIETYQAYIKELFAGHNYPINAGAK